jgi:hypothetical protein
MHTSLSPRPLNIRLGVKMLARVKRTSLLQKLWPWLIICIVLGLLTLSRLDLVENACKGQTH